jgi:hypothetical protein
LPYFLETQYGSAVSNTSIVFEGGEDIDVHDFLTPAGVDQEAFNRAQWPNRTIRFRRRRKSPTHCLPAYNGNFMSDTVKTILDRLEPGVHDPIPIKGVLQNDRTPWPEGFWYYRHVNVPRVNAIDIEASDVDIGAERYPGGGIFKSSILFRYKENMKTYLDARAIKGRHFFTEARATLTWKWLFFSDELVRELRTAKALQGFNITEIGLTHA